MVEGTRVYGIRFGYVEDGVPGIAYVMRYLAHDTGYTGIGHTVLVCENCILGTVCFVMVYCVWYTVCDIWYMVRSIWNTVLTRE